MVDAQEMREAMIPLKLIDSVLSFFELQEKIGNKYWNRNHFSIGKYSHELKMIYVKPLFSDSSFDKYREEIYKFEKFLKQNFHRKIIVSFYVPNPILKSKKELENSKDSLEEIDTSLDQDLREFINQ